MFGVEVAVVLAGAQLFIAVVGVGVSIASLREGEDRKAGESDAKEQSSELEHPNGS